MKNKPIYQLLKQHKVAVQWTIRQFQFVSIKTANAKNDVTSTACAINLDYMNIKPEIIQLRKEIENLLSDII